MVNTIIKWKCRLCEDTKLSQSARRHSMDICKCGKSGIDLEQHYQRSFGSIETLSITKKNIP